MSNNNTPDKIATAAVKFDGDKPRLDLIPTDALNYLGAVLDFGAKKYAPYNWAKGFDWSRLIGSALRHITAFNGGEDNDPESGLPHVAHALACLAMLAAHEAQGLGNDDRFRNPVTSLMKRISDDDREALALSILDAQTEFDAGKHATIEDLTVRIISLFEKRKAV